MSYTHLYVDWNNISNSVGQWTSEESLVSIWKKWPSDVGRNDWKKTNKKKQLLSTGSLLSIITCLTKTWTKSRVTFDSFSFFSFLLSFFLCPRYSEIMLDKVQADGGVKIGDRIDRKLRFFALNYQIKLSN